MCRFAMPILLLTAGCSWLSTTTALADEGPVRPNIVFILADDLGSGDLSCDGAPDAKTPRIDQLAAQGVRFTAYYAAGAECTPTRTALLTGRYPQRVGGLECAIGTGNVGRYDDAARLAGQHELGLPPGDAVLVTALKAAGYRTACIGKWHLGYEPKFHPHAAGFDRFFGFLGGNIDYFTHRELSDLPVFFEGRQPIERDGYMTHLIIDESIRFLRESSAAPYFLYVALSTPHFPFQGPGDADVPLADDAWSAGTREKYVEMVEDMDAQVGRLLDAVEAGGESANTLVLFASDHGAMQPGRNLPLKGFKGGLFEGGLRAPLIIRWPGRLQPGTVSGQPAITMDLTASLLRIGGADAPAIDSLDGLDIVRHVEDGRPDFVRTLFWRARRGERTWRAVRHGNLKYVHRRDGEASEQWLFNVARDPREQNNLLAGRPGAADALKQKLSDWETEVRPRR